MSYRRRKHGYDVRALLCASYKEEGMSFVESLAGVEAMWIGKDGEIRCSSGFKIHEEK